MTNELYLKRDDVLNLFEEYQPRLATHVSEFGDALEDLKFRTLESQPCEDAISREQVLYEAIYYADRPTDTFIKDVLKQLPPVKPQPKIDEIISRIEEARDKDQIAEYPYNRCIKIIREVLGDD